MRWRRLPDPVVLKYYLYQAAVSVGFVTPVFTLFLLDRGLSYTAISALSGLYGIVTIAGELPTGYVGDRFGRRTSLLAGSGLMAVSVLGFAVVSGVVAFAGLYVLWGLGLAFRSGTEDAWLYEAIPVRADDARQGAFTRVRGRGGAVNHGVTVITMLAGGVLFAIRPALPFLAAGLVNAASLLVVATFPRTGGGTEGESFDIRTAAGALRRHLLTPPLRSFVVGAGVVFATMGAASLYVQPIATTVLGLPAESLGGLYAGMTLVAAVASGLAGRIRDRLGGPTAAVTVGTGVSIVLVAPVAAPIVAVVSFFGLRAARAVLVPIASGFIGDRASTIGRATVLSAASLVYALLRVPLVLASGLLADAYGPLLAFAFLGVVCGVGIGLASRSLLPMGDGDRGRVDPDA